MTMNRMNGYQMSCGACAPYANAEFSCAHTASMQSANIIRILDAIIMASIIIAALVLCVSILEVLVALVLLVVVSLLVCEKVNVPRMRRFA